MAKGNILKQKDKKKKKKASAISGKSKSLSSLYAKVDRRKAKSISGAILLLLSIYLFIAFTSYLFSWTEDQDLITSKTFFNFIFESPDVEVTNWLGKFGAWTAHLFMFKWFGLASFAFSFLLLITGVRLLLNIRMLPLRRTYLITFIGVIWFSAFFGLMTSRVNYLGGSFGFATKEWLSSVLGLFGAILLILVLLFVAVVALFNPDFKAIFQNYFPKKNLQSQTFNEDSENAFSSTSNLDNDEYRAEMNEPEIADTTPTSANSDEEVFEENEEDEEFEVTFRDDSQDNEKESTISDIEIENTSTEEATSDNDFEVVSPKEQEPEIIKPTSTSEDTSDDEFSVEVAQSEKELSDKDLNKKAEDFGPYDPKLDLASYKLPTIDLLKKFESNQSGVSKEELEQNKDNIVNTLANYKIDISKIKATIGPTVTLYEIIPAPGVRISKIKNLEDDIALSLAALGIRIIAPIPGKGTIGIEVPNSSPEIVSMRSLIASEKFQNSKFELPIVLGKTITNETYAFDLVKMPHLLVAGATGQGKSVGLNAILVSILYKKHPSQVKFVLIDPKKVELTLFNKIERHFLAKLPDEEEAIITDTSNVVNTLNSLCIEMDERYDLLKAAQTRNIKEYNNKFVQRKLNPEKGHRYMPYIVVLIDEFADLIMTAGKEVEHPIARLAQLARAIGIHLIVATQRPSVNVITGMIKANFPARIAFRVLSKIDSRTILDTSGADQLIGKGDMLISTGNDVIRLQCGFVDTPEVEDICDYIGEQRGYPDAMMLPEYVGEGSEGGGVDVDDELDDKFLEAAQVIVTHQQGSASLLQRKLKLGYNRAGRIVDQLEAHGVIGPFQGSKARDVLIPTDEALNEHLSAKGLK
ncbi:FtsK/SpoIIIE family DNA translocase [Brumimicrobium aurantiacum]|uniref:DNA translocase FtsK n=1 Tax=Brumimicrobium aurantiacum TaxID=1737063 RepID=A0A3E1EUU4_9FLAO|nr:DNA translocase FtsK [Brumimicrobium aurantiacum]RFC53334.1 DNA translocase FtsK [Brumimicrobium aurantiacum]